MYTVYAVIVTRAGYTLITRRLWVWKRNKTQYFVPSKPIETRINRELMRAQCIYPPCLQIEYDCTLYRIKRKTWAHKIIARSPTR